MNQLNLPIPPPLPDDVRRRALDTVLSEINAPPRRRRRRTAPLLTAAAAVMIVGTVLPISMVGSLPSDPELGVATTPSVDIATPPATGPAYRSPLERCQAAIAGSGRADEYPDIAGWTVTEQLVTSGSDLVLAINDTFLCYVSPSRVWVSSTTGVQLGNDQVGSVQLVRAGPDLIGVLNPQGLGVSWGIMTATADTHSEPSTAKVQAIDLATVEAGARTNVGVSNVQGQYHQEWLPETLPDPIVVVDRPVLPRDSGTIEDAALDICVRPRAVDPNDTTVLMNPLNRTVAGESEPELWQPLARIDQPGGDFALLAGIGEGYAGLCVRHGDTLSWSGGEFRSVDVPADGAQAINRFDPQDGAPSHAWLFALGTDVTSLEMQTVWGHDVPCEIQPGLALCFGEETPSMTVRAFGADGALLQSEVPTTLEPSSATSATGAPRPVEPADPPATSEPNGDAPQAGSIESATVAVREACRRFYGQDIDIYRTPSAVPLAEPELQQRCDLPTIEWVGDCYDTTRPPQFVPRSGGCAKLGGYLAVTYGPPTDNEPQYLFSVGDDTWTIQPESD